MAVFYDGKGAEIKLPLGENPVASIAAFRKVGVVGDSFASGTVNVNGGQPSYPALSWPQVMGRLAGVEVTNFTKSGLSTRSWLTDSNGLTKLLTSEEQGLYILALGINDDNLGENYIGSITDIKEDCTQNLDTFYGNYGKIITQIQNYAPNSKIILTTLARQEPLKEKLDEAIVQLAGYFGIPFIVLKDDAFFTTPPFPMGNGHPTVVAYSGMAEAMIRLVGKCMADNVDYFVDYADENTLVPPSFTEYETKADAVSKLTEAKSYADNIKTYIDEKLDFVDVDSKQDKITGTVGQFVVIGSDGNVTTKTIPRVEEATF